MVAAGGGPKQQIQRRLGNGKGQRKISISMILGVLFLSVAVVYIVAVMSFSASVTTNSSPLRRAESSTKQHDISAHSRDVDEFQRRAIEELKEKIQPKKHLVRNFKPKDKLDGIKPQALVPSKKSDNGKAEEVSLEEREEHPDPSHVMKAYVEKIKYEDWEVKPLPFRTTANKDQLQEIAFPRVNSCKRLPERWPADEYPHQDTFLPWLHDAFPTHDGKFIQFVAQNRRRCHTGSTESELDILFKTQPSVSLFQHVPVKRVKEQGETRYQLASHEEADHDGVATRFICRFKPTGDETLSVFNFDYDFAALRKKQKATFKFEDGGIKSVHTSQLIFMCPVPESLVEKVKSGETVKNDWASLFVDLVPIRTPPRYGPPNQFLQPRYNESLASPGERFNVKEEWGDNYILPKIEDSGRWENIPICRPSLQEFYDEREKESTAAAVVKNKQNSENVPKMHRLATCIWASAGYATRGNRFAINDGQRRLLEWIHLNRMTGFEHFYLYDNSYAFSNEVTLKPIADLFPGEITYIKWPFNVCNNNPNNVDSPGERSSQYAAESSCRLRFGPHVEWMGQFDIDEYLVPMGSYTSMLPILDKLEEEGKKIISFGSWRAWPRRDFIAEPEPIDDPSQCGRKLRCFELQVPFKNTMLQTYNCDRQSGPKTRVMPAEKQIYRPDYVKQHFIHYSAVTVVSEMSISEFTSAGYDWHKTRAFPDPNSRFSDEANEATMLHTKAVARQDTVGWEEACMDKYRGGLMCRIGVPFPDNYHEKTHGTGDEKGWAYNCYPNKKIDEYWALRLEQAIKENHGTIFGEEQ